MKDDVQITKPDFEKGVEYQFPQLKNIDRCRIANYLHIAFDQGESYGMLRGYEAGYSRGHDVGFLEGQDSGKILKNLTDIVGGLK